MKIEGGQHSVPYNRCLRCVSTCAVVYSRQQRNGALNLFVCMVHATPFSAGFMAASSAWVRQGSMYRCLVALIVVATLTEATAAGEFVIALYALISCKMLLTLQQSNMNKYFRK